MKKIGITKRVLLVIFLLFIVMVSGQKEEYKRENPWLAKDSKPLVMAHGGGRGVFPGNTYSAFEYSFNLGVDVLEMDVQMTSDGILVLRHGENVTGNIKAMSDCDLLIFEETYDYLYENCNFGYNFQDDDGNYPYRGLTHAEVVEEKVYLTKLEELFEDFGSDILYNIEIKADGEAPRTEAADALNDLITEYSLEDYVLVATAFEDISVYIETNYPELYLSASHAEAQSFIIHSYTLSSTFYKPGSYIGLQIPVEYEFPVIQVLDLSTQILINNAHKHNMAVHYWTINDETVMQELINMGVDGIITDYPEVLMDLLKD